MTFHEYQKPSDPIYKIPLADLSAQYEVLRKEIDASIASVLASGQYVKGSELERFEREFAEELGIRHVSAVGNGTDALALALEAAGIGPGDEVILPANTFRATAEAVMLAGARPVLCDVDPDTLLVSAATVEDSITPRSRAVIPVHLFGYVAPMSEILCLARARDLVVVEDAAQAHGARLDGRAAGTFGDAGAFSFFPGKVLGAAGDAGAIVTDRDSYDAQVRSLRSHGQGPVDNLVGRNSRMDEIQAAVLRVKLRHLRRWTARRRQIEENLKTELAGADDIHFLTAGPGVSPSPLNIVIRTDRRDQLMRHLQSLGIESKVHYPVPIHMQPAFLSLGYAPSRFTNAETACRRVLSLPNYPEMTDSQIACLVEGVRSFFR